MEGVFVISGSKDTNIIHIEEQGDFLQLHAGFQFPKMAQPTYILFIASDGVSRRNFLGVYRPHHGVVNIEFFICQKGESSETIVKELLWKESVPL